ncbi:DUF4259 domain-containing protein [Actinocorallia longicatena]|uniref:DUF4259 domain-containing protein n=1 Tax=Actinocorallia longicatena TaxID=111803 RepID=A0ABP6QFP9_9ACTN
MESETAWWETVAAVPPWNAPWLGRFPGPFDSDESADDLARLAEGPDAQRALTEMLTGFVADEGRVCSDDADGPVAAACLVGVRRSGEILDESVAPVLEATAFTVTEELRALAAAVLDKAVRAEDNEYREWCESAEDLADWMGQLALYRRYLA